MLTVGLGWSAMHSNYKATSNASTAESLYSCLYYSPLPFPACFPDSQNNNWLEVPITAAPESCTTPTLVQRKGTCKCPHRGCPDIAIPCAVVKMERDVWCLWVLVSLVLCVFQFQQCESCCQGVWATAQTLRAFPPFPVNMPFPMWKCVSNHGWARGRLHTCAVVPSTWVRLLTVQRGWVAMLSPLPPFSFSPTRPDEPWTLRTWESEWCLCTLANFEHAHPQEAWGFITRHFFLFNVIGLTNTGCFFIKRALMQVMKSMFTYLRELCVNYMSGSLAQCNG